MVNQILYISSSNWCVRCSRGLDPSDMQLGPAQATCHDVKIRQLMAQYHTTSCPISRMCALNCIIIHEVAAFNSESYQGGCTYNSYENQESKQVHALEYVLTERCHNSISSED